MFRRRRLLEGLAAPLAAALALAAAPSASAAPLVLYTDVVSGPNSGGENGQGAYLSVFGKGFGADGLGSRVKVTVGGAEVARYLSLGPSKGRPDLQQITVQIGSLGNPTAGKPLPVQVAVDGAASNADQTFTVNPGRFLYVDNISGDDSTAVPGDVTKPYRHVQLSDLSKGAWGQAKPGDFIVMRGKGTPWTDVGFEGYFMRYRDKSGTAPTGASGTGPIALVGYPGEDVYIRGLLANGMTGGCVSAVNGMTYPNAGKWAVIANLRIDCEGYDGPVSLEIHGDHWRVVNNDLAASTAPTSGGSVPRMAGITGNGAAASFLGNHIHDIQGSPQECHGVYLDGDGSFDIGYNLIERIRSGNGFQSYSNGRSGSDVINDVHLHHNVIRDVSKHGINIADGSRSGFVIDDNLVYDTAYAGVRFNTTDLSACKIFNNTFYNTVTSGRSSYGILTNDWGLSANALAVENNIFWPSAGIPYTGGSVGLDGGEGKYFKNLWYGGNGSVAFDPGAVSANPSFVSAGSDFHLQKGSPAIDSGCADVASVVAADCDLAARPQGAGYDLGAYEYAGGCSSSAECTAPPTCRTAAGATCSAGACSYPAAADGAACADDGSPCTADACRSGACAHSPKPATASCDDGDACTGPDHCDGAGACAPGPNTCKCRSAADCTQPPACHTATGASCEGGACVYRTQPDETACADDLDPCTLDVCRAGLCGHFAQAGARCDDGDACTAPGLCSAAGACIPGESLCGADAGAPDSGRGDAGSRPTGVSGGCGAAGGDAASAAGLAACAAALAGSVRRRRRAPTRRVEEVGATISSFQALIARRSSSASLSKSRLLWRRCRRWLGGFRRTYTRCVRSRVDGDPTSSTSGP